MNDREKETFRILYEFYLEIRENPIRDQAGWDKLAERVGQLSIQLDIDHNPLGWHMLVAIMDTLNDLYKDGKIPMPDGYMQNPWRGQTDMQGVV